MNRVSPKPSNEKMSAPNVTESAQMPAPSHAPLPDKRGSKRMMA
jgi:hypothetical protein